MRTMGWALLAAVLVTSACLVTAEPAPCGSEEDCDDGFDCVDGACVPPGSDVADAGEVTETASSSSSSGAATSSSEGVSSGSSDVVPSSSSSAPSSSEEGSSTGGVSSSNSPPASSSAGEASSSSAAASSSSGEPAPSRLGVVVRTGIADDSGSAAAMRFCINNRCFNLSNPGVPDRERRTADTYVFTTPHLEAADVDRVALEAPVGGDAWRPTCLQVVLDGEPLHCRAISNVVIGNGAGETLRYETTNLSLDCSTCMDGALVGHTTPTSSLLWARVPGAENISVQYSSDAAFNQPLQTAPQPVLAANDHTVHVPLAGLAAHTRYFYRLVVDGVPFQFDPLPSFRTAPAGNASFDVAFGSCANGTNESAPFAAMPIYNHVAAQNPDVMLMLGDNHYANVNKLADRSRWLGALRTHYRKSRTYPTFMRLVSNTPTYAIWDDHDFLGNDTRGANQPVGRDIALQGFKEFWANPSHGSGGTPGTWYSFTWGGVEFFMLDGRYHRENPGGSMLGEAQLAWLRQKLRASTAVFKVIASGSVWHPGPGDADSWGEHRAERESIMRYIKNQGINGVFFLGGDIHKSGAWRIPTEVTGTYPMYEFVSSGLAGFGSSCPADTPSRIACVGNTQTFGMLRFVTHGTQKSVTFEIRNAQGDVAFSRKFLRSALNVP